MAIDKIGTFGNPYVVQSIDEIYRVISRLFKDDYFIETEHTKFIDNTTKIRVVGIVDEKGKNHVLYFKY